MTGKKGVDTDRLSKSEDHYTQLGLPKAAARPLDSYRFRGGWWQACYGGPCLMQEGTREILSDDLAELMTSPVLLMNQQRVDLASEWLHGDGYALSSVPSLTFVSTTSCAMPSGSRSY